MKRRKLGFELMGYNVTLSYYKISSSVAAIALALVLSFMAQAQDLTTGSAATMSDTNQYANPFGVDLTPRRNSSPVDITLDTTESEMVYGSSSGTTFSDSEMNQKDRAADALSEKVRTENRPVFSTTD